VTNTGHSDANNIPIPAEISARDMTVLETGAPVSVDLSLVEIGMGHCSAADRAGEIPLREPTSVSNLRAATVVDPVLTEVIRNGGRQ